MPFAPFIPLIGAGIQAAGNMLSTASNNKEMRRQRAEDRAWALQDRDYQNQYNSPREQMQRLKDAGLNPHLIYGGGGGAITQAATTRNTERAPQQPIQSAMVQEMLSGFLSMYDLQRKRTEVDRIKAETEKARAMTALAGKQLFKVDAETGLARLKTDVMKWQNQFDKDAAPFRLGSLDIRNTNALKQGLLMDLQQDKMKADIQFTKDSNVRQQVLAGATIKDIASKILQRQYQNAKTATEKLLLERKIENLEQDFRIRQFEEKLNKSNLSKNDPALLRIVDGILNEIFYNF